MRPPDGGLVDGGEGVRPRHADQLRVPPLPDQWPACLRRTGPSGWRRGWSGDSWTSSCTACTACTLQAMGIRRATGTPCSRTSRDRGPATPSPRTTLSAPSRGMQSASSCASGLGPRRAGGGPKILSRSWSGVHGRWLGCRGWRKCLGLAGPRLRGLCGEGAPGLP